jgi:prepilin-type N-terminal cleavage/methylation domain-containing protein
MMRNQKGFTLIELLIVVVIIGILAAIAIPKFGKTREKAYVAAMQSDLKQVMTMQEMYYGDPKNDYTYWEGADLVHGTPPPAEFSVTASSGVTISVTAVNPTQGTSTWHATATHSATDDTCDVFVGDPSDGETPVEHAKSPGVVACGTPAGT